MKKFLLLLILIGLVAGGLLLAARRDERVATMLIRAADRVGVAVPLLPGAGAASEVPKAWRTAVVEQGPIQSAVLATGTLQPVQTVQVSSQVSGQLVEILADFNAKVKAGDLIARLDPTTFQGRVASAEADLVVAEATVTTKRSAIDRARAERLRIDEATRDADRAWERARRLEKTGAVTERSVEQAEVLARQTKAQLTGAEAEIAMAQAEVAVAEANVAQKRAAVKIARTDLERTNIRAPIDGIVIDRQVELGQTVAASLSAPTLFIIAAALEEMQLEASIDEADVGRVRDGQAVQFTVDAYPGKNFRGKVAQVRRAAKSVQNVVTYTAVVTADNSSQELFPGMTANVRLIVDRKADALKVPQAAIRFRPVEPGATPPATQRRPRTVNAAAEEGRTARIHRVGADGRLEAIEVSLGIAAENQIEIVTDRLKSGDEVAIGPAGGAAGQPRRAPLGF